MTLRSFAALLIAFTTQAFAAPAVSKIEPPGWWAGHSINPVRLMIRGRDLVGARLEATREGTRVGMTASNPAGTYLFADVFIDTTAAPGSYPLRLIAASGTAEVPFSVLAALPPEGRFQGFSPDDVVYLIMPDRFANGDPSNDNPPQSRGLLDRRKPRYYHGGDFQGIVDHLSYLKDLGVTAIWMTPVYDNYNRLNERQRAGGEAITDYHGYGAVDYYAVEEHFGDLNGFRALVDAAHRIGIKVIQDQVANHTGPYHPWVKDPPTPTWFNGTEAHHLANNWQIWTLADPHATPAFRKPTLDGWFVDVLPDLNQSDPEVARYLIQNTLWWVGVAGLDGIRQDTLPYVPRAFWRDWTAAIKRQYPRVRTVGEMWDTDPSLVAFFQGGRARRDGIDTGIDALFDFPLFDAVRDVFVRRKPASTLPMLLGHDRLYPDPDMLVTFLGLHDTARFMGENGADTQALELAWTLLLTTRGIPLIYYGDEIGMRGGEDPDNRRDFPGGWPEDARNAFLQTGRTPEEQAVFSHVRGLAHLRAETPALRRGRLVDLFANDRAYAYARVAASDIAVVAINAAGSPVTLECDVANLGLADGVMAARLDARSSARVAGGQLTVQVPPRSSAVFTGTRQPRPLQ